MTSAVLLTAVLAATTPTVAPGEWVSSEVPAAVVLEPGAVVSVRGTFLPYPLDVREENRKTSCFANLASCEQMKSPTNPWLWFGIGALATGVAIGAGMGIAWWVTHG